MRDVLTFKYYAGSSLFHRLDGRTKMLLLIGWIAVVLLFWDARVLGVLLALGCFLLAGTGIPWRQMRAPVLLMGLFVLMNAVFTNLLVPSAASRFVPQQTTLWQWGFIRLTLETTWYTVVLALRYLAIFTVSMLFVLTTDPGRIANGIYRAGLGYKAAFVFQIAFRYLPTVSHEYMQIVNAQRARGLRLDDHKAGLWHRVVQMSRIIIPLLMSSLDRVDVISNAMDLRAFGTSPRRTWYNDGVFATADWQVAGVTALTLAGAIAVKLTLWGGFWMPF